MISSQNKKLNCTLFLLGDTIFAAMNSVENILLDNIDNPDSLFIFPTNVAASRWADHALKLRGGGTVAMRKFIEWDTFKENSIRSRVQNKRSIPSPLRKIFAACLTAENAELCEQGKPPVFSSLINTRWAAQAASFAGWIAGLLPQLGSWVNKAAGLEAARITGEDAARFEDMFDGDDRDLFALAFRYAQFLEENGLFEPAWEKPPFDDTGKECFIFFPDCLADYSEYKELLEASGHVRTVYAPECGDEIQKHDYFYYTNSRSEISEAALYIRSLHENEKIPWDSIAVSVADSDDYEPYVLREFTNRNIPFVKKTGKPLASYPAGQFFKAAANCASRNFAFSALADLLLNNHIPWKNGDEIRKLIDFGINNNCVSSWTEMENGEEKPVNVWDDAFETPYRGVDISTRRFFDNLKRSLIALRSSNSFAEIRKNYFVFRERFLDMEKCLPETNVILSRCISELMRLAEIEKDFPKTRAPDPFMFFIGYLGEVKYLAQQNNSGVVILPYRTAAPAPFDCHIVIGASQSGLSAVFSRLDFLPKYKREKIGLADEDASAVFIKLHKTNSFSRAAFFCAEHSFSGYAIPHSQLKMPSKPKSRYGAETEYSEKFSNDLILEETDFLKNLSLNCNARQENQPENSVSSGFSFLHDIQADGFAAWASRRKHSDDLPAGWKTDDSLLELIRQRLCGGAFPGKYSVSASSLEAYYRCPLYWLFERVLSVENVQIEADLMAENIAGLVYHAALNCFFSSLRETGDTLAPPAFSDNAPVLPDIYRGLLERSVDFVFENFPCLPPHDKPVMSALTARLLGAGKNIFRFRLEQCLAAFLSYFAGCRVAGSEAAYQSERDTYFLNGIVDCILELPPDFESAGSPLSENISGGAKRGIIVDFKMNSMPDLNDCSGKGERGLANFQLPMYLTLAEEKEQKEIHTAAFFSIMKAQPRVLFGYIRDCDKHVRIPKKDEELIIRGSDLFNGIMNDFSEKARRFAGEIENGQFLVFETDFDKCLKCEYHRICRTTYSIGRERNFISRRDTVGN